MSKEKMLRLSKYANDVKSKLSETTVPEKHKGRPEAYKLYLQRELAAATAQVEALKMSAPAEGKK